MEGNPVRDKSYEFALHVVQIVRWLQGECREFVLSKQLLRAGTSIGANIEEALAGSSRKDFVAKMAIASKEAREAHYWLRLLRDGEFVPRQRLMPMLDLCNELVSLLTAIVKTGQRYPGDD